MSYLGPDKFIYPVWIDQDNYVFTFDDDESSAINFKVETGWYYPMIDTDISIDVTTGTPDVIGLTTDVKRPLFNMVTDYVNSQRSNDYAFQIAEPTDIDLTNGGVELALTSGSGDYALQIALDGSDDSYPSHILLAKMLGLRDVSRGLGTTEPSTTSPVSPLGVWHSQVKAHDKRADIRRDAFMTATAYKSYSNAWSARDLRRFRYFDVDGSNVRKTPEAEDPHPNNFYVDFWSRAAETREETIVVHKTAFDDGASLDPDDHADTETLKLSDPKSFGKADSTLTNLPGGERYDISFIAEVTGGSYAH